MRENNFVTTASTLQLARARMASNAHASASTMRWWGQFGVGTTNPQNSCEMTLDDLEKATQGRRLLSDIGAYTNKKRELEDAKMVDALCYDFHTVLDADLIKVAIKEQIKRHQKKIEELQKQFDEL